MRAALLTLLLPSTAYADIPPDPHRPEWDHTPLPMPDEPAEIAMLVVLLALIALGVWWARRADRREA